MKFRTTLVAAVTAVVTSSLLSAVPTANAGSPAVAPKAVAMPSAAKKPWRPTEGGKFNIPRSSRANELRLERQVIDAINKAKPHSKIRMVMFSFDRFPVTDALIRAKKKRKVSVQVIVNGHEYNPAERKLKKALGGKRSKKSFFYMCKASCRGQGDVQHSKFVLFSQTGAARNVVMLGSLNMKWNGIHNQFNDLLTLNDRPALFSLMYRVFVEMKRDKLARPSYIVSNLSPKMKMWVLPFPKAPVAKKSTKWTMKRDPITKILNGVTCTGAATKSGRTSIRVSMHAWDASRGAAIARKFRDLYARGCDVKIESGFVGRQVRQIFGTRTARGYVPLRSTGYDTDGDGEIDKYSHMKMLLINGNYEGARNRKVVVTGSANYQHGGQYGDELIFRLYNTRIYNQYAKHWNRVYSNYTHGFGRATARTAVNGRMLSVPTLTDALGPQMPDWRDE